MLKKCLPVKNKNVKIAKKVIEVIAIILVYNIILIVISSANKMNLINIFGYKSYIIKTNSMEKWLTKKQKMLYKIFLLKIPFFLNDINKILNFCSPLIFEEP